MPMRDPISISDEPMLHFSGGSPREENPVIRDHILAALATVPLGRYTTQEQQLENFRIQTRHIGRALRDTSKPLPISGHSTKIILTAGASGGIDLTFRYLKWVYTQFQEKCTYALNPTILMAAPTYGLLVELAQMHGFKVEFLPLQERNGWAFSPQALRTTLEKIYRQNTSFPIGLLDVSPHNPTGLIRDRRKANILYEALHHTLDMRYRMMVHMVSDQILFNNLIIEDPSFHDAVNFLRTPKILDDLAYCGLEHNNRISTPHLALADKHPGIVNDTFTVVSASKSGAPAARAGMLLIGAQHYNNMMYMIYRATDAPSPIVAPTLEAAFSMAKKFTARRDPFMRRRRKDLRRSALLARVLINGTEDTTVPEQDTFWLKKELHRFHQNTPVPPIPAVRILPSGGDAGMFHLIEFDQAYWESIIDTQRPDLGKRFTLQGQLEHFLADHLKIGFLPPRRIFINRIRGNEDRLIFRMNHDMDSEHLVTMAARLRRFIKANPKPDTPLRPLREVNPRTVNVELIVPNA